MCQSCDLVAQTGRAGFSDVMRALAEHGITGKCEESILAAIAADPGVKAVQAAFLDLLADEAGKPITPSSKEEVENRLPSQHLSFFAKCRTYVSTLGRYWRHK